MLCYINMEQNKSSGKVKYFLLRKWNKFIFWFTKKDHPHSKLNTNVFFYDLLKLIGLILVFLIIYSNIDKLNQIVLIFIKVGSILQLVLLFFILRKTWHLTQNLKYAFRGLNHGTKTIMSLTIILLLLVAVQNQGKIVNSVVEFYENGELQKFNPIDSNLNLNDLTKNLNTCQQINVSMKSDYWKGLNIAGESYNGWTVKGDASCRKGTKEGENLNKYYCGGYTNFIGIGMVNAYVEKTIISKEGEIGKTYKYVIWNIYDENGNFVETRCVGDPDEFNKKQAEAFYREMSKWR